MVIQKVINNNVISAYDVNQQEIVIMGKGIQTVSGTFRKYSIRAHAAYQ